MPRMGTQADLSLLSAPLLMGSDGAMGVSSAPSPEPYRSPHQQCPLGGLSGCREWLGQARTGREAGSLEPELWAAQNSWKPRLRHLLPVTFRCLTLLVSAGCAHLLPLCTAGTERTVPQPCALSPDQPGYSADPPPPEASANLRSRSLPAQ